MHPLSGAVARCRTTGQFHGIAPTDRRKSPRLPPALCARSGSFHPDAAAGRLDAAGTTGMRPYERHRFATIGIYHEQGMLDGRWVDVMVMEKILR